jgi:hypothetical protein
VIQGSFSLRRWGYFIALFRLLNAKKQNDTIMDLLHQLAQPQEGPCVSISLNTHRTHPDSQADGILLKKLCRDATDRLVEGYGKRETAKLVERIQQIPDELNMSYNLDSLHIFISNSTREIVKKSFSIDRNGVQISDSFAIKPLLKALSRTERYLILVISQASTALYTALDDVIIEEVTSHGFPFEENPHYLTRAIERSDTKRVDNQIKEYFNTIDKAVVAVHRELDLDCVVISVAENYPMLLDVADKPSIYLGNVSKHYKDLSPKTLAEDAWTMMQTVLADRRKKAIAEMREAIAQANVITDITEIYRAAKEGRGDLLLIRTNFRQAAKIKDEFTIERAKGEVGQDVIDDITSDLAWEVYSKKGRVVFLNDDEVDSVAEIAMKLRY